MHFYTNDVVATSKIPILSPRVRFPVGVFFLAPVPLHPPLPPWAETRSHEYPRSAGEATDSDCGHLSGPGRVCDFWCWNDLEWTGCSRVTGHRTETTIMFFLELGAVPMRDRVDGVCVVALSYVGPFGLRSPSSTPQRRPDGSRETL